MLLLTKVFFIPTGGASLEMKTAYFILVIPTVVKKLFMLGAVGVLVTGVLQAIMRMHKKAILSFNPEEIQATGNKLHITIPIKEIKRIDIFDPRSVGGAPKGRFKLEILDKWDRSVDIRLLDYSKVEELMNFLEKYKKLDIKIYDFNVNSDMVDERSDDQKPEG